MNHVLRWFGYSGRCCPPGYYSADASSESALEVRRLSQLTRERIRNEAVVRNKNVSYIPGVTKGCNNNANRIQEGNQHYGITMISQFQKLVSLKC